MPGPNYPGHPHYRLYLIVGVDLAAEDLTTETVRGTTHTPRLLHLLPQPGEQVAETCLTLTIL